jgi:hypothetical protein
VVSCGDAPHLRMLNLIAGSIPASLEFYRRLGVTVPPPADQHVQGVEPYTLYLPLPAAGHESVEKPFPAQTCMRSRAAAS